MENILQCTVYLKTQNLIGLIFESLTDKWPTLQRLQICFICIQVTDLALTGQQDQSLTKISMEYCLFDLILYFPSSIFQLNRDGSSWVEPVLSYDKCVLLKDHNAVTLVRLKPSVSSQALYH